ncbi:M23 family metallopeptidase [Sphaerisporangium perillae]|uniref:M23 family metallopeptidase n=1 Tax=Sphaerisporangium perillae TaxID=2935860 RepID=UPI00200F84C4|nr:M23 family metallopeptidase [Sphaerisporangium perillae]
MRPGRLTAIAATVLVSAACAAPSGVPGISTLPPAPLQSVPAGVPDALDSQASPSRAGVELEAAEASPSARAEIDAATLKPSPSATTSAVKPPAGEDPVRVPPPRISKFTYVFPVRGCRVSYARKQLVLPKTTIWAGKGCAFVSPVGGVVHEVNASNRWKALTDHGADREGRFVSVLGADGVRYFGGHLDSVEPGLRAGDRVGAGQVLGRVGDSGNAKGEGANLYFSVSWPTAAKYWWVRRGMVDPWTYLDAWLNGNPTLSPAQQVAAARSRVGATPPCRTLCASKPVKKKPPRPVPTQTADPDGVTKG